MRKGKPMPKKRNDGRYELKVRISKPNEPRRYKAVYGSTLREAQEKKRKLEAEIAAGIESRNNPTVTAICEYYINMREPSLRPQTVENYRHALDHITALIGDRMAKDITVDDARETILQITDTISANQGSRARKIVCMVWDDAIARSVTTTNPWRSVPVPKHTAAEKRFLTDDELLKIEKANLIPSDRALISVLRYTGIRIGEAVALQVKDIDDAYVHVRKTSVEGQLFPPKTKAGKRSVPMPTVLKDILLPYIRTYTDGKPDTFLFSGNGSSPWTKGTIWRHFEEIGRQAFGKNVPDDFTPHVFRHTYTHDLVSKGIPPLTAQVLLGHSSYAITLGVYAHFGWQDVDTEKVMQIFNKQ